MARTRRWNPYDDESPDDGVDPIPPLHDKYHPSEQDIAEVRRILKGFKLPTEVIDLIQEGARYWCRLLAHNDKPLVQNLRTNTGRERKCHYIVSPAIPTPPAEKDGTAQLKVKEVVFWIRSRDQGEWDTEGEVFPTAFPGTYADSWTWFEACIYRRIAGDAREDAADSTDLAERLGTSASDEVLKAESIQRVSRPGTHDGESSGLWHLQSNVSESSQVKMHKVVWTDEVNGEDDKGDIVKETGAGRGVGFVSSLKAGR